jgi:DNA excision repair protein ERCC-3
MVYRALMNSVPASKYKPLIVQSDGSLLLDVHDPGFEEARAELSLFAELEKSPEHIHTYRMTPLSLWNAASAGVEAERIQQILQAYSRYPIPQNVIENIRETIHRYGKVKLRQSPDPKVLLLEVADPAIREEILHTKKLEKYYLLEADRLLVPLIHRGTFKQEMIHLGYPVQDEAPLLEGEYLEIELRSQTSSGRPFTLRSYQKDAAQAFLAGKKPGTGFGTLVLPCGAGKTVIGMAIMAALKTHTLILTTNVAAVHQWIDELLDKTTLSPEDIGEYTGSLKTIRPVTVCTYQILVWRSSKEEEFPHFRLFREQRWGLIIYDEVHLLPAPMFRITAEIQSIRRLGLTATLVREDGREADVFSLVGPKRYDVPWKQLESQGWIAEAECIEIRVDLPENLKLSYALADKRGKFRIASENPYKLLVCREILKNHPDDSVLIIGQYLSQLGELAKELKTPLITGKTPNPERERIFRDFKQGRIRRIVVSKVANFAIDLPDASVAIQVSGTFGSRQEEAQRLGRILRLKQKSSYFYSLISRYTTEETFGAHRQKFLTEQGYKYRIELWDPKELV